jgi:hypothetical protein
MGLAGLSRRAPPWLLTAVLGLAYVIAAPASADLAAASYRSDLFARAGFTLWDNGWYAGHHLPAYSVLAPALGALLGQRLLQALCATLAAALFAALVEGRFPPRAARIGAIWFAFGVGVELLSGRVPFDLGLALGLAALLAARSSVAQPVRSGQPAQPARPAQPGQPAPLGQPARPGRRGQRALAYALAVLSTLASPVAGAFLALAGLAWALGSRARRHVALALAALAPVALLAFVFPEGGSEPFAASSFWPALAGTIVLGLVLPVVQRTLRAGALLYALALTGSFVLSTSVGGNAVRLGALLAGPLAACVFAGGSPLGRRPHPALALAFVPFLLYWQLVAPVRDFAAVASEPSVHASYYAPLLQRLRTLGTGAPGDRPLRIEVVPTREHWEARWVAPSVALARGWERQLDRGNDALFYAGAPLTPARYRAWLLDEAIAYVALPDAPLDQSGRMEARLLDRVGELREVWRSRHWRLFAVLGARPLAEPPAVLSSLGTDSFTLEVPRPGVFVVRVRFTPYWALLNGRGCVRRASGDWTELEAHSMGVLRVGIDFSLARVFAHGPRCH